MTSTDETWLPVVGHEGRYEVSDLGRVCAVARVIDVQGHSKQNSRSIPARILRAAETRGYLGVSLWQGNTGCTCPVHLLVAAAFLGLSNGVVRPCFWCGTPVQRRIGQALNADAMTIDHRDHDHQNNRPHNLVPSCNRCNGHRMSGSNWKPWVRGEPIGRTDLSHPTCGRGHEWTPENTCVRSNGKRICRTCRRNTKRAWDDARRSA